MDDKQLNKAISNAKYKAGKKLKAIQAREGFDPSVIANLDPRRNAYVPHMTREGKIDYLNRLKSFNSVATNFYKDHDGNIITQSKYSEYKAVERLSNEIVQSDIDRYGHIKLPSEDRTIADRQRDIAHDRLIANPSGTDMFIRNLGPDNLVASGIDALIASMSKKFDKKYKGDVGIRGRNQFEKMVQAVGDNDLIQRARELTNEQWWALWNYTSFATEVSLDYLLARDGLLSDPSQKEIHDQTSRKINQYVDWASTI